MSDRMGCPSVRSRGRDIASCAACCLVVTAGVLRADDAPPSTQPIAGELVTLGPPAKPADLNPQTEGNTAWNDQRRLLRLPDGTLRATGLESVDGVEEPTVRWVVAEQRAVPDDVVNIRDVGDGAIRMTLRYSADAWDGDQGKTATADRQRAEVKGLGPHQRPGETFEYGTTFRLDPDFRGSGRFCHVFQLKATDGDNGAPLVTVSILEGVGRAELRSWPAADGSRATVPFAWTPGQWTTIRLRIRTTATADARDGLLQLSVDGEPFHGPTGIALCRPGSTDYRPKWGLYRGIAPTLRDDWIEHRAITARKVD